MHRLGAGTSAYHFPLGPLDGETGENRAETRQRLAPKGIHCLHIGGLL